jgi:endonuclease G
MARRDVGRLRDYLSLITKKHGGIKAQIAGLKAQPERLSPGGLESATSEPPPATLALRGMEKIERNREPSPAELFGLEAIINEDLRPAVDVVDGKFSIAHPLWSQLSTDAAIRRRIENVIPSIGRIELPGHRRIPYGGTGFVVGDGLIMTNRHVAEIFAEGLGDKRLDFIDGSEAGIDFLREQGRPTGPTLMVRKIVMIHPYWDMAILSVDGIPATRKPLRLSLKDARDMVGHDIFVIGYPAFDPRNPADVQNDVFGGRYGVKKLQPGELQGGMKTSSFGKMVLSATHDCSTLGGNSGSAVIDLETGEVMGLHFGGLYHQQNYSVPSFELGRDARVIAAGVAFAGQAAGGNNDWADWWTRADATERPAVTGTGVPPGQQAPKGNSVATTITSSDGSVYLEVPLRITISLGQPGAADVKAAGPAASDSTEALREPFRDTDYSSRAGYDPDFLNAPDQDTSLGPVTVPMPVATDTGTLAEVRDGGTILKYQNFSIAMHAKRRLALFTASNVTEEPKLRKPDPNEEYTRRALSGLGPNDQERWFVDPRLDEKFQIPDVFFTKDRKAFDKGHIVRRDDVAWGATYESLRRANGDSYHVTNCSPQVSDFNQSARGEDNWGDLENHVLSEAANERLCVFAGPVLDPSDEVFVGKGDGGTTLRAKIPSRFWKVMVARVEDGIAAYGFVLEQDLSDVEFREFTVPPEFLPAMTSIADIESLGGIDFADVIRDADQLDTVRGEEVGRRSGARRRKPRR